MPSYYPVQLLGRVESLINFMCGLANEPLTAEEQRYHDRHGTYDGTSFTALHLQLHDIVLNTLGDVANLTNMSMKPHSGDRLTGKGQEVMYTQDPATTRQFDAIIEKFGKRCEELRSKPSTGPLMTSLMDLVQSFFQDIKNGRDPFEEINDDPIYHFTATAMTDLFTPEAGSENAAFKGNVQEYSSYRFPLHRMVQNGLDVHRKIRDFRERIDPTDRDAFEIARQSLEKTLDEYEKVALRLIKNAEDPSYSKTLARIMQQDTWKRDIIGVRGYAINILPLIRSYKEGLSLGIDPALLPQYSLIKRAHGQLDNAVATLRDQNVDGRYDKVLESAGRFRTAFDNLSANKDPAGSEQLMKAVCSAMNELADNAGEAYSAHKQGMTSELTDAFVNLRSTSQSYLEAKATYNTFRHITETVEKHYEKRRQLEAAPRGSELRRQQNYLSGKAFQEDHQITSDRQKQSEANIRYYKKTIYGKKHEQSIEGNIYDSAFQDERLFAGDFKLYYPRLADQFPDLANPDATDQDKVSALRSAAGHYLETLEEVVRETSQKLIETRHFVINAKLLTDKKKIAELVSPDNTRDNPLIAYWYLINEARTDLNNAQSIKEIQEATHSLTKNFKFLQEHHRDYQDPDIAAAIKVQMDEAAGELKIFAGPSDYSEYFRRRVTAIGTHCRDKTQATEAANRLVGLMQSLSDPGEREKLPLADGDLQKLTRMGEIANQLKNRVDELSENTVTINNREYLPTAIDPPTAMDPDGEIVSSFLRTYTSLSPEMKACCGNTFREIDENAYLQTDSTDPIKNNYFGEDDLRLVSAENVDRFCKLSMEANEARSRVFDHKEFRDYRASLQAVSDYAHMVKEHPGNTEVILHMANLMRTAGSAAQTYLIEKGAGKRSSETGNIRYNNAYAALYLTAPKDATTLSQTAKNLNITAERTRRGEKREHLSLETLMKEEFGNLDRTYKKSADGQGYEKVKPAQEKHGKKK